MAIVGSLCALAEYSTASGRADWMCPLILQIQVNESCSIKWHTRLVVFRNYISAVILGMLR